MLVSRRPLSYTFAKAVYVLYHDQDQAPLLGCFSLDFEAMNAIRDAKIKDAPRGSPHPFIPAYTSNARFVPRPRL